MQLSAQRVWSKTLDSSLLMGSQVGGTHATGSMSALGRE